MKKIFIAILRLLARSNLCLDEHLRTGPRNAKYTSRTFQIAADQICEFYWGCLKKCPHFSIMADEVTSHGQEILSVCLHFLEIDNANFQHKPTKHEVLLDFSFLQRITGVSTAQSILGVLEKHRIDIRNCRVQAYDTTSSIWAHLMLASKHLSKGWHLMLTIKAVACIVWILSYANYQIFHQSKMFDSCQQAYLFFHNSPKGQRFLEHIISCSRPASKKTRIMQDKVGSEACNIWHHFRAIFLPNGDLGSNVSPKQVSATGSRWKQLELGFWNMCCCNWVEPHIW